MKYFTSLLFILVSSYHLRADNPYLSSSLNNQIPVRSQAFKVATPLNASLVSEDDDLRKTRCKIAKRGVVVNGVLLGIGVGALSSGVTLLATGATSFNDKKNALHNWLGGGLVLVGVIIPPFTIWGLVKDGKKMKKYCGKQSVQIAPTMNGVSFAYRF